MLRGTEHFQTENNEFEKFSSLLWHVGNPTKFLHLKIYANVKQCLCIFGVHGTT